MTDIPDLIKRLREHWTGTKGRLCQEAADALKILDDSNMVLSKELVRLQGLVHTANVMED